MTKAAAIDLGTNTFHILIATVKEGRLQIIRKESEFVLLGQGGISDGKLTQEAMKRAFTTLTRFAHILKEENISAGQLRATATSAVRSAANKDAFVQEVARKTGIDIEIIDGDTEAAYIYRGVKQAVKMHDEKALIVDIGGGSVEFIIANDKQMFWRQSFEIGAQETARYVYDCRPHSGGSG